MPRPLRVTVANIPFHILNRGNNRQAVFKDEGDFNYFIDLLLRFKKELHFKIYHFCLMSNHTHFVMEPIIEGSLPKIMLKLTLAHTRYFNAKYESVGHAWQGRYKSSLIDSDDYFIWCGIYCELNPVRAKMVKNPKDWQWSSFRYYAFGDSNQKINDLIDCDPYYEKLGKNAVVRRRTYRENIGKIMDKIFLERTRKQLDAGLFGKEEFVQNMKEKFKIGTAKPPGRPRKNQS